jgi:hypothetical protein
MPSDIDERIATAIEAALKIERKNHRRVMAQVLAELQATIDQRLEKAICVTDDLVVKVTALADGGPDANGIVRSSRRCSDAKIARETLARPALLFATSPPEPRRRIVSGRRWMTARRRGNPSAQRCPTIPKRARPICGVTPSAGGDSGDGRSLLLRRRQSLAHRVIFGKCPADVAPHVGTNGDDGALAIKVIIRQSTSACATSLTVRPFAWQASSSSLRSVESIRASWHERGSR